MPLTPPMKVGRAFLLFRIGKRMAASVSKLLDNALLSIQGRERNSSKVVPKGIGHYRCGDIFEYDS